MSDGYRYSPGASYPSAPSPDNTRRQSRLSRCSASPKKAISYHDAYLYSLRVAFLFYLLHPRHQRGQSLSAPRPGNAKPVHTSSFHEYIADFSRVRDSKSKTLPKGFVSELEKCIKKVLSGKDSKPEYQDPLIKISFAEFYNALGEQNFRKRMDKDGRAEELVLIFFSSATKALMKGHAPDDSARKLLVDQHVALFVRMVSRVVADFDWIKERPELAKRLSTLEEKLLRHDRNLATQDGASNVVYEISYDIKHMSMVQTVLKVFRVDGNKAQADINEHKDLWTTKEALQDLKKYQSQMELSTKFTLCEEDFETPGAFESWKKLEAADISKMMLALLQSSPSVLTGGNSPDSSDTNSVDRSPIDSGTPVDRMSTLSLSDIMYTFIPPSAVECYRLVLAEVVSCELRERPNLPEARILSKPLTDFLDEICLRWRIPPSTRVVALLDVFREKYVCKDIDLETLIVVFNYVQLAPDNRNSQNSIFVAFSDRSQWTKDDVHTMNNVLTSLYEAVLRELFETALHCYEVQKHPLGPAMMALQEYIESDPFFVPNIRIKDDFKKELSEALHTKAKETYNDILNKVIPEDEETWEFFHIAELGQAIVKLCNRVQKRYKTGRTILGVDQCQILYTVVLPQYAHDALSMVDGVMEHVSAQNKDVPADEAFFLYKEYTSIREIHHQVIPEVEKSYDIEQRLEGFVWRWIKLVDEKIPVWVINSVKQDNFILPEKADGVPDDQRYTSSVQDFFRSLKEVVSQITDLKWQDELANARFMTALSRSIGIGVSKYCEILETEFKKEMSRPTAEQEEASNNTRQGRWMQMAKDAFADKDKVVPFNFLSQSFVRLNNILSALNHLDRLQQGMDVGHHAEIIAKLSPPLSKRQRKATSYIFTVKIVEAEDLKACDFNGLSDPYVVLTDVRRLHKTRVVNNSLNPKWDESVDIITTSPLNLLVTAWDYDAVGPHGYIGRTSLKLDPSFFQDFGPRDYWLDLDTQGRILIRVSMEGERDEIQFYIAKAFRTLKRTEREMTRIITDKLSAYITYCLSRRTLKALRTPKFSIANVSSYFNIGNKNSPTSPAASAAPSEQDCIAALEPLYDYMNENFRVMNETLTEEAMTTVMSRIWKEILLTLESLLFPPLSDKPSSQRPLAERDLDIIDKWMESLFDFFSDFDRTTGRANGVPIDVLKCPKYHEFMNGRYWYHFDTPSLIRVSEDMASAVMKKQQAAKNRSSLSHSATLSPLGGLPTRGKSIMCSKNLGTMRKAKEEKRKVAQADPSDDMILRILRMRPEAADYLRNRSSQKQRLATVAAADMIVKQSLLASTSSRLGRP